MLFHTGEGGAAPYAQIYRHGGPDAPDAQGLPLYFMAINEKQGHLQGIVHADVGVIERTIAATAASPAADAGRSSSDDMEWRTVGRGGRVMRAAASPAAAAAAAAVPRTATAAAARRTVTDPPAPVDARAGPKRKLSQQERAEEKKRRKRIARANGGGRPTNKQEFDKAVAKAMSDPKQGRISFFTQIDQSQGKRKAQFVKKMGVSNLAGRIVRAAGEVFADGDCDSDSDSGSDSGSDGGGGEGDRSGSGSSEPDSDVEMAAPVAPPVAPPARDPPAAPADSAAGDAVPGSSGDDPDDVDFDPLDDALSRSSSGEDLALQSLRRELAKKAKEQSFDFREAIADLLRAEDDFVHDQKRQYTRYEESERQFCLKALYAMGTDTKGKWKFTAASNLIRMVGAHFSSVNKGLLSLWPH